ncbi:MAG: PIN domain-containing protein [Methanoregulaceae archaeon]|jgi:predicted nucleic acid-binding protein
MRLVIDTNRIIAGFLKSSSSRGVLFNPAFRFYAPDVVVMEITKHSKYLREKAHLTEEESEQILSLLISRVTLVPFEHFQESYSRACSLMEEIDKDDAPFLAVGIALKLDGIWTADWHFLQQKVLPVYSNRDLECREQ